MENRCPLRIAAAGDTDREAGPVAEEGGVGVAPQPVPTMFVVGTMETTDGPRVVLQAQTPVGVAVYFLEPGAAVQVGNHLRNEGKAGVSRLTVPKSGLIVPSP